MGLVSISDILGERSFYAVKYDPLSEHEDDWQITDPTYMVIEHYDSDGHRWYGIKHTPSGKCVESVTMRQPDIFYILAKVRAAEPEPERLEAFIETCK